ncbi:DUF1800 domain-containing protein [Paracoccus sp. MBLB3053]|uniref:DUF1800 domain-containing protein n=1 Tax=Paracoccus aurantius TaxID=3073814 RepID=A0ABU2HM88_9RHOB|nr:DUF1800 domain-containing protein [Paracoccus sp. MBLB3053]MDS9466150.1 DUF1800 domain-containing protein [Paracoccus sp. MBLB3053]
MTIDFPELAAIRLGFGLSPIMAPPPDVDALLAGLARSAPGPGAVTTAKAQELQNELMALRAVRRQDERSEKEFKAFNQRMGRTIAFDLRLRMARAVDDPTGFGERLVQFWADHFTIRPMGVGRNPLAMAFVDEAIRPHIAGRFEDMFFAADTHPMMLVYLDQNTSRGPNSMAARNRKDKKLGLNENLAREAMELHSLGAGAPYTQDDVRELAELLTGLTYDSKKGFAYRPQIAEPGAEQVLGVNYGGEKRASLDDIRAAFRDIARRPETAQYLSRKLAVHFVSDDPSPELVEAMASVWRETGGDLPQVYRVLATHPDLAANLRAKVRQPFDLVVAGFRALGITGKDVRDLEFKKFRAFAFDPMARMGQRWMNQNGPDGWPEDPQAWIAPQLLAARITWATQMPQRMLKKLPDPREMLVTTLGSTRSDGLAWAVPKAESQAEGVALILASNDFNRR